MHVPAIDLPADRYEAMALQRVLAAQVHTSRPTAFAPRLIAGLDIAYSADSEDLAAAAVVLDLQTFAVVESANVAGVATFPYVPGLFAFRELPPLLKVLELLKTTPDALVVDGHGIAHPRRFGLGSHLGVVTGIPSFGVAKNPHRDLGERHLPVTRGAYLSIVDDGTEVGRELRTQHGVKPVYVSVGHLIDLDTACELVLQMTPKYRLPEATRLADQLSRVALRGLASF